MKIKSFKTGLEQEVSEKTFKEMEALKPGAHQRIADDVQTPPEAMERPEDAKKRTVLPAGATAPPDALPK